MRFQTILYFTIGIFMCCSLNNSIQANEKSSEVEKKAVTKAHEKITKEGVLADFINKISKNDYNNAIMLLHPKLKEAWTIKRFSAEWKSIREQLSTEWAPEATSSFSGMSAQGPYKQATYRLSSNWRSLASVDLISMKKGDQDLIVRVHVRVPYGGNPPKSVNKTVDQMISLAFKEKYKEIEKLMTSNCKQQFPAEVIKQLRPILGNDQGKVEKTYYRLCANTVWYDAVRLAQSGGGFTFLELILESDKNESKIASLTFRGKMR